MKALPLILRAVSSAPRTHGESPLDEVGGGECSYDHLALMNVPVLDYDKTFEDIFATAHCMPALEHTSEPRVIAPAERCSAGGRPQSVAGDFRYGPIEVGAAGAHRCARRMGAFSPFVGRTVELATEF